MLHEAIHKKTTLAATLCFNSHAWRTNVALLCHLPNQYFHSKLDVSITKKTSSFTIYVNDKLSLWTNFQKSCNAVHQVKHWHFFFFFSTQRIPVKGYHGTKWTASWQTKLVILSAFWEISWMVSFRLQEISEKWIRSVWVPCNLMSLFCCDHVPVFKKSCFSIWLALYKVK